MSLSNPSFVYNEAPDALIMIFMLRLMVQYSAVKPTNCLLISNHITGKIASFNYRGKELFGINLDSSMFSDHYDRYIVMPLLTFTDSTGDMYTIDVYDIFSNEFSFSEYQDLVTRMAVEGHCMVVVIDLKTKEATLVDNNYLSPPGAEGLGIDSLTVDVQDDVRLKALQEFFEYNEDMLRFKGNVERMQYRGESITDQHFTSRGYSPFKCKRANTILFVRNLILSEPMDSPHIGTCVPVNMLIAEWLVQGGSIEEKMIVIRDSGVPLFKYVLEFIERVVEEFYPRHVMGMSTATVSFKEVFQDVSRTRAQVLKELYAYFNTAGASAYLLSD